ncbi:DHHC palmitoyltransferase-domain-containing protein [Zopfochytrium polystomum]|nr:DHHC palmitoyltransferase-domain-containing protein [Zopfochytrium polystomum]
MASGGEFATATLVLGNGDGDGGGGAGDSMLVSVSPSPSPSIPRQAASALAPTPSPTLLSFSSSATSNNAASIASTMFHPSADSRSFHTDSVGAHLPIKAVGGSIASQTENRPLATPSASMLPSSPATPLAAASATPAVTSAITAPATFLIDPAGPSSNPHPAIPPSTSFAPGHNQHYFDGPTPHGVGRRSRAIALRRRRELRRAGFYVDDGARDRILFRGGDKGALPFLKWLVLRNDAGFFGVSIILIIGISALFAVYCMPTLVGRSSPALAAVFGLLLYLSLLYLFKTSFMDPGFLPVFVHAYPNHTVEGPMSNQAQEFPDIPQADLPSATPVTSLSSFAATAESNGRDSALTAVRDVPLRTVEQHRADPFSSDSSEFQSAHLTVVQPAIEPLSPASSVSQNQKIELSPAVEQPRDQPLPHGYPFIGFDANQAPSVPGPVVNQTPGVPLLPEARVVSVNGVEMKLKYCQSCLIWRTPRAAHCYVCDRCVDVHDHHCPWTGNCIGKRNYRFFVAFLLTTSLLDIFVFAGSIATIVLREPDSGSVFDSIAETPALFVIALLSGGLFLSLSSLLGYHLWLSGQNLTTHEEIRNRRYGQDDVEAGAGERSNRHPFHLGSVGANLRWIYCRPIDPSFENRRYVDGGRSPYRDHQSDDDFL